jgi:hypothetical protein
LTQLKIPSNIISIGHSVFSRCSGLTQLKIPLRVMWIAPGAFSGCSGLVELEIPVSVEWIGDSSFSGCSGLTRVQIPSTFSSLFYRDVFNGVKGLEHLTLLGSPLSPAVVASLEGCLVPTATVIGSALVGQKFGRFTIRAA